MIKIPYRLIRKLTCVLALAAVLVTSFVSPSYADNYHTFSMSAVSETASETGRFTAPSGCKAVTKNGTNQYTIINAAGSQGGTKFRRANTWTANIPLSELGITPEYYNGNFKFNEYQVDGTTLREWWQATIGTDKYFYKSNQLQNPNSKTYLWFDGDEIQWQKGDGKNCT